MILLTNSLNPSLYLRLKLFSNSVEKKIKIFKNTKVLILLTKFEN